MNATPEAAELIGAWKKYKRRTVTLTALVRSECQDGKSAPGKVELSQYEPSRLPLTPPAMQQGIVALYRVRKTMPQEDAYTVAMHKDGTMTCDCKWSSWRHHDNPEVVCVHISLMMTIADLASPMNAPLPTALPTLQGCPLCGGAGEVVDPLEGQVLVPCPCTSNPAKRDPT